jgi:Flp pilus assembly protein TadD
LGDYEASEARARRALALDPSLGSAWLNLGLVQNQLGDRDEARRSFVKAHDLDPDDPRPLNNLADLDELEREEAQAAPQ